MQELRTKALGQDGEVREAIRNLPPRARRAVWRIGRNDPCPCNSGVKFKRCCMDRPCDPPVELKPTVEPPSAPPAADRGRVGHGFRRGPKLPLAIGMVAAIALGGRLR